MSTCCYVFYSFRVTVVNKDVSIYLYFSVISVFVTLYYLNLLSHFLFGHLSVFSFTLLCTVILFMSLERLVFPLRYFLGRVPQHGIAGLKVLIDPQGDTGSLAIVS